MDNLTKRQRRRNMQNIRSKNTLPEKTIRKELQKRKIRFSQYLKSIAGCPDFVFRKKKIVLFIDSDFWHGHPSRYIRPKSNRKYWDQKIADNIKRDKKVNRTLKKSGWKVVRIWEYDIKKHCKKIIDRDC